MKEAVTLVKHLLILGRGRQSFLGARWVTALLRASPRRFKRPLALRLLALSPHYFYRHVRPEYERMPKREFLEAEFERNRSSRALICDRILRPHLRDGIAVLDIGCGPGFLARQVASHAGQVYAADISPGVLECARALNHADNLHFIESNEKGYGEIADGSLDFVYSFAVIQHVTDEVFAALLKTTVAKLRTGGEALFHVVLEDEGWKTEREWVEDGSLKGSLKYKYGLNCFSRKRDDVVRMLSQAGFATKAIVRGRDVAPDLDDDISSQHLISFEKIS
jgi:SAM-dependent methyltransferase